MVFNESNNMKSLSLPLMEAINMIPLILPLTNVTGPAVRVYYITALPISLMKITGQALSEDLLTHSVVSSSNGDS